jgi:hypothetical protein
VKMTNALETYTEIREVVNDTFKAHPYLALGCDCDHISTQLQGIIILGLMKIAVIKFHAEISSR